MHTRRKTVTVKVGGVPVGSGHPIVVQSMTNTDTADAAATARQVAERLAGAHQVEVGIGRDAEERQHLVEHLAVLRGGEDAHVAEPFRAQAVDHRRELHGFRPRAECDRDLGAAIHGACEGARR